MVDNIYHNNSNTYPITSCPLNLILVIYVINYVKNVAVVL